MPNHEITVTFHVGERSRKLAINHLLNELQGLVEGENGLLSAEVQEKPKKAKPTRVIAIIMGGVASGIVADGPLPNVTFSCWEVEVLTPKELDTLLKETPTDQE